MKKYLHIFAWLILLNSLAFAQVIADFETGPNNFAAEEWGNMLNDASSGQVADPSGRTAGVFKVSLTANNDGNEKAAFATSAVGSLGGKVVSYDIWLPANTPADLTLKVFSQTTDNWDWKDIVFLGGNLVKEKWVKVYLDLEFLTANGADYTKVKKFGIEFNLQGAASENKSWSGDVFIDNVSILGSMPKVYADFETGPNGFAAEEWGNMLNDASSGQVADPSGKSAGVFKMSLTANNDGNEKAAFATSSIGSLEGKVLAYNVWLPANTPNDLLLKVFSQTTDNWDWKDTGFLGANLPKEQWVKVYLDLEFWGANGADYTKLKKCGIEFNLQSAAAESKTWSGDIYIDNVLGLSTDTAIKWVMINFESAASGTNDFNAASWAPATKSLKWAADPTGKSQGVLELSMDFTTTAAIASPKSYMSRDGINMLSQATGKTATKLTLDVWLPEGFPQNAQFGLVIGGGADISGTGWLEYTYFLANDSTAGMKAGQWNSMVLDIAAEATAGKIDPTKTATLGMQLYIANEATFKGSIYFDNLTLEGIPAPAGKLVAPKLTASAASTTVENGNVVNTVRFDWVDNTLGTETYSIYISKSPITDLKAPGVTKIYMGIPHGLQKYAHRPWTNDGGVYDYYYAITSNDAGVETELTNDSKVGPISIQSSVTMKAKYVANFGDTFQLDGLADEFEPFVAYQIEPETAGGAQAASWTKESTDLYFKTTMIVDDNYLYISADVTDDDLRTDEAMQAWEGDALEFYMGFYDAEKLSSWHAKNYNNANGDWRIGFTSRGEVALSGGAGSVDAIPGVEATVFQKFTGDGYIIEARLNLDSLVADGSDFVVYNGMKLPLRIDNNDWDPTVGDESRSLILQVGGVAAPEGIDMNEDWLRPHAWGFLEVVDGPTAVEDVAAMPVTFKLHNNYPNPFNPTTTIKYDIPENSHVSLKVYDILGREVATLINGVKNAGYHQVTFDASRLASGTYVYRITTDKQSYSKKMLLLK